MLASTATSLFVPPHKGFPPSLFPGCLPRDNQTDLWCPGDGGYGCYKIPSLLHVPGTETLLAFIEARNYSCDDHGFIDLLYRRSTNLGADWDPPKVFYSNSSSTDWHTIGDALPIYDRNTKAIHLIFTRDNTDAFAARSDDHGVTWSIPRNISSTAVHTRGPFVGTGHAGGIQLASGRLIVPMYGGGLSSYVLASDDAGGNWSIRGAMTGGNEWAVAPLDASRSGRLLGSLRGSRVHEHQHGKRLQSYSNDGGESWSKPTPVPELTEPIGGCEGSLVLHPNGNLYYAHPDPPLSALREVMNVKVSADGGKTWRQHAQVWGPDHGCAPPCVPAAGYSSLVVMGDEPTSLLGLQYGRNNATLIFFEARGVAFTTVAP